MTNQQDSELIENALNTLGEHFDSITIFANKHEGKGTEYLADGRGNWYGRIGQIREWLLKEDHKSRLEVECNTMEDDEN